MEANLKENDICLKKQNSTTKHFIKKIIKNLKLENVFLTY